MNAESDGSGAANRLRLLAALGGGIVHELANRICVIQGMIEEIEPDLRQPGRARLRQAVDAAVESLALLRNVSRMIDTSPKAQGPVELAVAARAAAQLLRRHVARDHDAINVAPVSPTVRNAHVRVAMADLVHAIVTAAQFAMRSNSAGALRLDLGSRRDARALACVRIEDRGPAQPYARLGGALTDLTGVVPALRAVPGSHDDLLLAVALLRRHGGDLLVEPGDGGDRALCLCLPEVGR
jgi:hypothetical protein